MLSTVKVWRSAKKPFLLVIALLFFSFNPAIAADQLDSKDSLGVNVNPAADSTPKQNPPGFNWPRAQGATGYELFLRWGGESRTFYTLRNWFLPDSKFGVGEYFWKVRPLGTGVWSDERHFVVNSEAASFVVPSDEQLLKKIRQRIHPRSLAVGQETLSDWVVRIRATHPGAISLLEKQVQAYAQKDLVTEQAVLLIPRAQSETLWVESLTRIRQRTQAESRQIRAAAILWRLTGNAVYRDEAIRRGDALAALDPYGSTSHLGQDQGNRAVAWGLTLAFDYLGADLPTAKKTAWLGAIRKRTTSIFDDLRSGGWRLEQHPFDSHGSTNIGYLAAISAILIDRIPEAETWFRNSFRSYANYLSPWGDEEGGFGNGSAYAEYSTWYFMDTWDAVAATTSVNLYEKPWSKGLLRFLACFVAPGSPRHAFGDAAETAPNVSTLKAFAARFNDAWASWYSRNLIGDEDALTKLTNPVLSNNISEVASVPATNTCFFKYIGWVAMHSQLGDRGRTSVYFKSSRYGSYNHSHGDQNSFVIVVGGRPMLTDSGSYDWYGSPSWSGWYRKTMAHNAITFDGGQGQVIEGDSASSKAQGQITRFSSSSDIDFGEGDATKAYGGALSSAIRRIWYLRAKNAVLVWDKLDSPIPRTFEWNMHSVVPFRADSEGNVEIRNNDQSVCVVPLLRDGITFQNRENYLAKASATESHGFFRTKMEKRTGEFLFLVDIGCSKPAVSIRSTVSGKEVSVGGTKIFIGTNSN